MDSCDVVGNNVDNCNINEDNFDDCDDIDHGRNDMNLCNDAHVITADNNVDDDIAWRAEVVHLLLSWALEMNIFLLIPC